MRGGAFLGSGNVFDRYMWPGDPKCAEVCFFLLFLAILDAVICMSDDEGSQKLCPSRASWWKGISGMAIVIQVG